MAVKIAGKASKKTNYGDHLEAKSISSKPVIGKVSIQKTGDSEPAQTDVEVHKAMIDGGVRVGCSGSRTVNLGNYESVKIGVWLEMPCTKDTMADTFEFVSDWVGEKLAEAVTLTKGN